MMIIDNNRGCNQIVSDADTLLLYITLSYLPAPRDHIDLLSTEVETKNSSNNLTLPVLKRVQGRVQGRVQVNFKCSLFHLCRLSDWKTVRREEER